MPRHPADYVPTDLGAFDIDRDLPVVPQLYEAMRTKILSLELKPGEQISETTLAETAGVSRTPARQVVKDLVRDHLLVSRASRSTFVSGINTKRVAEALVVRRKLEPHLASECAKHPNRSELVKLLHSTLAEHRDALAKDDSLLAYDCDFRFHKAICTFNGDGLLWQFTNIARAEADRVHALSKYRAENLQMALEQHGDIVAAIEEGNEKRSADTMEKHMSFNEEILTKVRSLHPDMFEKSDDQ